MKTINKTLTKIHKTSQKAIKTPTSCIVAISLSGDIMTVAKANEHVGDWAAYIKVIKNQDQSLNESEVLTTGTKLNQTVAETLFPQFKLNYKWRR